MLLDRWLVHLGRSRGGAGLTAVGLLACALLSSCADPGPEQVRADYCDAVRSHQRELTDIAADTSPGATFRALPAYRDLRDHAPEDIAPDWSRVVDRIEQLQDALRRAGVSPDDYGAKQWQQGLSTEQRNEVERAAAELADPRTAQALADVEQQARDVCHTPLSL
jgi:hypothetical protein